MNRAVLVGRLTKDPELRTTTSGISKTTFTLAVNRRTTNEDGTRQADFISCVAWRGIAETIAKYCTKGKEVAVEGRIETGSYDAFDGTKRYTTDVVIDNFSFVGGKAEPQAGNKAEDVQTQEVENDPWAEMGEIAELTDADLPF